MFWAVQDRGGFQGVCASKKWKVLDPSLPLSPFFTGCLSIPACSYSRAHVTKQANVFHPGTATELWVIMV